MQFLGDEEAVHQDIEIVALGARLSIEAMQEGHYPKELSQ